MTDKIANMADLMRIQGVGGQYGAKTLDARLTY